MKYELMRDGPRYILAIESQAFDKTVDRFIHTASVIGFDTAQDIRDFAEELKELVDDAESSNQERK